MIARAVDGDRIHELANEKQPSTSWIRGVNTGVVTVQWIACPFILDVQFNFLSLYDAADTDGSPGIALIAMEVGVQQRLLQT